jgi:hypothetical protein
VSTIEELLGRKYRGFCLEIGITAVGDASRRVIPVREFGGGKKGE